MPLYNPPLEGSGNNGGNGNSDNAVGFYGATPQPKPTGYTALYNPTTKALGAYTPMAQTTPFVGGLLDLLSAARLSDLNTVRLALENLRTMTENVTQQHNQLIADLKALGLIG